MSAISIDSFEYNPGRDIESASFYDLAIPAVETNYTIRFVVKEGFFTSTPTVELSGTISKDKFSWPEYVDGFDLDDKAVLAASDDGTYPFEPGDTVYLSDILDDPAQAVLAIKAIN